MYAGKQEEWSPKAAMRRFINILAEDASTVAAWMVPRMRGVRGRGKYFKCGSLLTLPFLTSLCCIFTLPIYMLMACVLSLRQGSSIGRCPYGTRSEWKLA